MTLQAVDWSTFYGQLHGFVASRVRSASDVDDLVQLILERAMSKAADAEIGNTAGWLFGVARNAIADHYRAHARTLIAAADAMDAVDVPLGVSDEERAMVIACMESPTRMQRVGIVMSADQLPVVVIGAGPVGLAGASDEVRFDTAGMDRRTFLTGGKRTSRYCAWYEPGFGVTNKPA